jgi:integrase
MPCLENLRRVKRHQTILVVVSLREVQATFARMTGTTRLMAELICGIGMRINECVTLRVKDIDFDQRAITVRAGKGNKDRATLLPQALIPDLRNHSTKVAQLHKADVFELSLILVPGAGLEPAQPCGRGILSPLRLPISPPGPWVRNTGLYPSARTAERKKEQNRGFRRRTEGHREPD